MKKPVKPTKPTLNAKKPNKDQFRFKFVGCFDISYSYTLEEFNLKVKEFTKTFNLKSDEDIMINFHEPSDEFPIEVSVQVKECNSNEYYEKEMSIYNAKVKKHEKIWRNMKSYLKSIMKI